jgi:hypothetical protein
MHVERSTLRAGEHVRGIETGDEGVERLERGCRQRELAKRALCLCAAHREDPTSAVHVTTFDLRPLRRP